MIELVYTIENRYSNDDNPQFDRVTETKIFADNANLMDVRRWINARSSNKNHYIVGDIKMILL